MDSLFWKMGSLKAMVAAKSGRHCEGSSSDLSSRPPINVCACRSPPSETKPAEEISTESITPQFKPLPLPSSRATVPTPLKFLWFTRKNQPQAAGNRSIEPVFRPLKNDEPSPFIDNHNDEKELCNSVDLISLDNSDSRLDVDTQSQISAVILSDAIMANVSSIKQRKSWISRITDLRALWPIPRPSKKQSASSQASDSCPASADKRPDPTLLQESSECEVDGCHLEVSYRKVLHNKESFSNFLEDVSLPEMKDLAQMSSLCDMAYTIPEIQSGFSKYRHLKYVTSSLEKKAEAESKLKETELSMKATRSDVDRHNTKGTEGLASSNGGTPSQENVVIDSSSCQQKEDMHCDSYTHVCDIIDKSKAPLGLEKVLQRGVNELCISRLEDGPGMEGDMSLASISGMGLQEETKKATAKDLQSSNTCPSEWFICDDPDMHTRYFVIQGSESLASWQTNLIFEPTKFEGLDVLVHRGIYEAANALYEQVLPEVLAHFSSHGDFAQVRLTGHSLGGSLGTLLALMFQIRGVLPRKAILPVITFGSPCIMCGGDRLLQQMNLPASHIQSIIMHRDVVPRAFSCDYPDHVAQVLKRLNGKFRDHPCLNNQKLLYAPMGQLFILQPNEDVAPSHPLLPCGHGLYLLRHPVAGEESMVELRGAQRAFLNMPHPLEILSDRGAYGLNGAVSRDHDPCNYMKAIHLVLKHEAKRLGSEQREQKSQLLWLLWTSNTRRGLSPGLLVGHTMSMNGALTPVVCKTSMFFKQLVNYGTTCRIGSALGRISMWEFHKGAFSRYARLIASKHAHLGMLVIVSLRLVILDCLSTIFVWI